MVEVRTANQLKDLKELLTSGGDVSIAVAYVSNAGLDLIEQEMVEALNRRQRIRFLLHLDGKVTSPDAVNKLLELSRHYRRKLALKFFFIPNAVFHPKLYISDSGNEIAFLTGSYNLTKSALTAREIFGNVEHGLWVRCDRTGPIGKQVLGEFEGLWNDNRAFALDRYVARRYSKAYSDNRESEQQSETWQAFIQHLKKSLPSRPPQFLEQLGETENPGLDEKSYWLFKCDVNRYNFSQLLEKEDKTDYWGNEIHGRGAQEIIMNEIKVGDGVLFYHFGNQQRAVVGIAQVVSEAHLDPDTRTWQVVDIKADSLLKHAVTLQELQQNPKLQSRNWRSRQSILRVSKEEWEEIVELGTGK